MTSVYSRLCCYHLCVRRNKATNTDKDSKSSSTTTLELSSTHQNTNNTSKSPIHNQDRSSSTDRDTLTAKWAEDIPISHAKYDTKTSTQPTKAPSHDQGVSKDTFAPIIYESTVDSYQYIDKSDVRQHNHNGRPLTPPPLPDFSPTPSFIESDRPSLDYLNRPSEGLLSLPPPPPAPTDANDYTQESETSMVTAGTHPSSVIESLLSDSTPMEEESKGQHASAETSPTTSSEDYVVITPTTAEQYVEPSDS
jgi:hypothetical protein